MWRETFRVLQSGRRPTLGEKAIGILAFQQLGGRCEIVSRTRTALRAGRSDSSVERRPQCSNPSGGEPESCPVRRSIYRISDPDVLRVLTQRKVVDYLRARRGPALARGDYEIEVTEGRSSEWCSPKSRTVSRLAIPRVTLCGDASSCAVYVTPADGRRRRVAVVGRAGTTVVDDLCELEEFAGSPWDSNQVSGRSSSRHPATDRRPSGDPSRPRRLPAVARCGQGDRASCCPDRGTRRQGSRRANG